MTKKDTPNKTKKRLPSGRIVEELDIDIEPPPTGDVEWIVTKIESIIIDAATEEQATIKAEKQFDSNKIHVIKSGNKWKATRKIKTDKVIAHTFFEARSKGMTLLCCGPDEIEAKLAPQAPVASLSGAAEPFKGFDPWKGLRESVKAGKRREKQKRKKKIS